jgi:hypothetical protein
MAFTEFNCSQKLTSLTVPVCKTVLPQLVDESFALTLLELSSFDNVTGESACPEFSAVSPNGNSACCSNIPRFIKSLHFLEGRKLFRSLKLNVSRNFFEGM